MQEEPEGELVEDKGEKPDFYMDGYLRTNLTTAKRVIKKDWDMVFAVDGAEGSGKSVLAMQLAKYCDNTFSLERVVFTPNTFRSAVVDAKKNQAIVYDEAYTGLSSRATMSMINRTLIKMLAEIRQKNLFIFVVMPSYFDLDKYVALWRSRALIHVYTGKNFERGYFAFFNVDRKKELYVYGKKFYNYNKVKANFIGRFANQYVVDEKEYRKKKNSALIVRESKAEEETLRLAVRDKIVQNWMEMPQEWRDKTPNYVVARLMNLSEPRLYQLINEYKSHKMETI